MPDPLPRLTRRAFTRTLLLAAGSVGLAAPDRLFAASSAATPLRLGLLVPSSHLYPALSDAFQQGFQLGAAALPLELTVQRVGAGVQAAHDGLNALLHSGQRLVVGVVNEDVASELSPLLAQYGSHLMACNVGAQTVAAPSAHVSHHSLGLWQSTRAASGWARAEWGPRAFLAASFYESGFALPHAAQVGIEQAGGHVVGSAVSHVHPEMDGLPAIMARIAELRPDWVHALYAEAAAATFLRAYAAAGLLGRVPLVGSPLLVEEALRGGYGPAARGIVSVAGWTRAGHDLASRAFARGYERLTGKPTTVAAWLGFYAARTLAGYAPGRVPTDSLPPTLYLHRTQGGGASLSNPVVGRMPLSSAPLPSGDSLRSGWLNAYLAA